VRRSLNRQKTKNENEKEKRTPFKKQNAGKERVSNLETLGAKEEGAFLISRFVKGERKIFCLTDSCVLLVGYLLKNFWGETKT
jgi:hypothetical protein